ncbi:MAG: hypothetical protein HFI65_03265 [Lachnospiraceae bacterium]|nr:hypothetical protein [Lachnospiraceae bacterium]
MTMAEAQREAHAGARPSHAARQGRVYSHQDLEDVCGLGDVAGLCGANCRHSYYAFFPGISSRAYPDGYLEELREEDERIRVFGGREFDGYGATQRQRQYETTMRSQRVGIRQLKEGRAPAEDVQAAQGEITQAEVRQYKAFKKVLGNEAGSLADFREIKYNDDKGWEYLNGLKSYLEKYPTSDKRYYDAGEKLKELGIRKGILLPPVRKQAFILPEGKRDPYHIMHRMMERNISDDDVRTYMEDAKAMFVQWGGRRQLFGSGEGMCLVTSHGDDWIYKTVWSKYDFDEDSEKILEVLKHAGL